MAIRSNKKTKNEVYLQDPIGVDKEGNEISLMDVLGTDGNEIDDKVEEKMQIKNFMKT
jgi:RNA polymerase, sigma 27/28 subunit, RpsK/SigK